MLSYFMAFRVAVCKINQKLDPAKGKFTVEKYGSSAETVREKGEGKRKHQPATIYWFCWMLD